MLKGSSSDTHRHSGNRVPKYEISRQDFLDNPPEEKKKSELFLDEMRDRRVG